MPNQYLPAVPPELIENFARQYYQQGYAQTRILVMLKRHYDTNMYGLGLSTLKKYYTTWGLQGTRKQGHTMNSIHDSIQELRIKYPNAGAREMCNLLRIQKGLKVSRALVLAYFHEHEPAQVQARKAKRFVCRHFYAAGVNHIWAVDQHDKWQRFGLKLHLCVEVCSGVLIWLRVWWTNSNPRFVAKQYTDAVRKYGAPLLTQSDLGSENYGIANAHTSIRQYLDPSLAGTLQHRWMHGHANIKPEIAWKQLRVRWARGFEELFDQELYKAYDPVNVLQKLIFRWLAVPWIQLELDGYVFHQNNTARRADRHKVLPHGIPQDIFDHSLEYGVRNYKIDVQEDVIAEAEQQFCPAAHPVFELIPSKLHEYFSWIYDNSLQKPIVGFHSFWNIYKSMLMVVEATYRLLPEIVALIDSHGNIQHGGEGDQIPLMPYDQQGGFGLHGVPSAVVIEENIEDDDIDRDGTMTHVDAADVELEERENDADFGDVQDRTIAESEAEYEAYISE